VALVWYSAWQMECCGEPFSVNDWVEWNLTEVEDVDWLEAVIGSDLAVKVTHQEDHHELDENAVARKGRVRSIRCAYSRYAPAPGGDGRTFYPVPGTAEIRSTERVDGTEYVSSDLEFNGYLVELDLELN
jgi:hypothetical protein